MPWIEYSVLVVAIIFVFYFAGSKFVQFRRCVSSGRYSRAKAAMAYFLSTMVSLLAILIPTWFTSEVVERFGEPFRLHSVFIGEPGLLLWIVLLLVAAAILLLNVVFSVALVFAHPRQ